ncbi:MAG: hypothetical protein FIA97_19650 [Methylococcaceae bacterium]|nr:hypothetical protein [Methylococcaceae bacterium]
MAGQFAYRLTLFLVALVAASLGSGAWAGADSHNNLTDVRLDRYTLNGNASTTPGRFRVKEEVGDLYKNGDFIPIGVDDDYSLEISEADMNAINGQFVMSLALWTQFSQGAKPIGNPNAMRFFPRSSASYSIGGVPYVIVTTQGAAAVKPVVSLTAAQASASETGPVEGRFLIALNAAIAKDLKVTYLIKGKAKNGKDYRKIAKKVVIPAGNVSAYVDISPIDDRRNEGSENVTLKLKKAAAYRLGESKSASVEIADND